MTPEEIKKNQEYALEYIKKLAGGIAAQQPCPSCGYCPTCGQPKNIFNRPYYNYAVWAGGQNAIATKPGYSAHTI